MIALNSIMVVLMMEALIALFLLFFALIFFSRKKAMGGQDVSNKVIDKLQNTEESKAEKLSALISTHCNIAPDVLNKLLTEVNSSKRHLYQQIIRMHLNKDSKLLESMEQHIDQLSEPYCKILAHSSSGDVVATDQVKEQEQKNQLLIEENIRLSEQLTIAMNTMDEISAEYTRVFNGTQTELELKNSSKKMFAIFQQAGSKTKTAISDAGMELL